MGTYILILKNNKKFTKEIGSLGEISFPEGYYTYTGSVPKTNFNRIERHKDVCSGNNETEHWHIDYILHSPTIKIIDVFKINKNKECEVNNSLNADEFHNIGASDCTNCESHIRYTNSLKQLAINLKNINKNE